MKPRDAAVPQHSLSARARSSVSHDTRLSDETGDTVLFSGNRHATVPRALFFDPRLTPLERNAWQIFRLHLDQDGPIACPSYRQLRTFLASMPGTQASCETVARALTVLRLTRWLSLVRRRRDRRTGRILGNFYVLHDEPLTPFEAMQLDAGYLGLVSQSLTHASKAIQHVGHHVLCEIDTDPMLDGKLLPTRLQLLSQRLKAQGFNANLPADASRKSYPQSEARHESEDGAAPLIRNCATPASESESGTKPPPDGLLRNPKQDSTVRINTIFNKVRTVPRACARETTAAAHWRMPQRFFALKSEQQCGAQVALQRVDAELQQAVLDEWDARCQATSVRHPAGYLFGIIQKAIRGEFKAWATQRVPPAPIPDPPSDTPPHSFTPPEQAYNYLAHLREMLR